MQRPPVPAGADLALGLPGLIEGEVSRDRGEGGELRVQRLDAGEIGAGQLDRRDPPGPHHLRELRDRFVENVVIEHGTASS